MQRRSKKEGDKRVQVLIIISVIIISLIGFGVKKVFFSKYEEIKSVQAKTNEESKNVQAKTMENSTIDEQEKNQSSDDILKGNNVTIEGNKYTIDRKDVEQMISDKYPKDGKKLVFLTFDDGPSIENTGDILDILKSKEVKATFFVLGVNLEKNDKTKQLLQREIKEGHAIGNHTVTHNTKKLYSNNKVNIIEFMGEVHKNNEIMRSILGDNFDCKIVRMPGGYMSRKFYKDPNLKELDNAFEQEGFSSIDWNAENGDAKGKEYTKEEMLNWVKSTSKNNDKVILLMHDGYGKKRTKEVLPEIIDYFKEKGYEFKTIK